MAKIDPTNRWRWLRAWVVLTGLLGLTGAVVAQEAGVAWETEARVKVAFVYNFPKFVDWPSDDPAAPIVVCVVGSDPIRTFLGELSIRKVGSRGIRVVHLQASDPVPACHMMFLPRSEETLLPLFLSKVSTSPVLTISDIPDFVSRGGMIGFVTENGRVRMEIGQGALRKAGLKVRAKLLEIAKVLP